MCIGRLLFGEHDEGLLAGQMLEEFLGLTLEEEVRLAGQYKCRAGDLSGDAA
jgi:hypothetical protein